VSLPFSELMQNGIIERFHGTIRTHLLPEKAQYEYIKGGLIGKELHLVLHKDIEDFIEFTFTLM